MKVSECVTHEVATIDAGATVAAAAARMREHNAGDLVVVKGEGARLVPIGILTDRDIAIDVVGRGLDCEEASVADVMQSKLVMISTDDDIGVALRSMSRSGVRRAPAVDAHGLLRGILSMDDLIGVLAGDLLRISRLIRRGREHELARTAPLLSAQGPIEAHAA